MMEGYPAATGCRGQPTMHAGTDVGTLQTGHNFGNMLPDAESGAGAEVLGAGYAGSQNDRVTHWSPRWLMRGGWLHSEIVQRTFDTAAFGSHWTSWAFLGTGLLACALIAGPMSVVELGVVPLWVAM